MLLLYADNCAGTPTTPSRYAALNRVAAQGVTGWLVARRRAGGKGSGVALAQVLGVMADRIEAAGSNLANIESFELGSERPARFKSRYCGMQLALLTNVQAALGLEVSLGIDCQLVRTGPDILDDNKKGQATADKISDMIFQKLHSGTELIMLHLDSLEFSACDRVHNGSEHEPSNRCLEILNRVAERVWGDGDSDILQGVIVGGRNYESGESCLWGLGSSQSQNATGDQAPDVNASWLMQIRPNQSCDMHNGQLVVDPQAGTWLQQRVMYALHHRQATRSDLVSSFTAEEVTDRGKFPPHCSAALLRL